MFEELVYLEEEYNSLIADIAKTQDFSDEYTRRCKRVSELWKIIQVYQSYKKQINYITDLIYQRNHGDTLDSELTDFIASEIEATQQNVHTLCEELEVLSVPKEIEDNRAAILEIRAGAGGDEAALFANELMRMYLRYAEASGMRPEILSTSETGLKGLKEAILLIREKSAYKNLQFESGVHRVQRVPTTESSGRIHTSTVTVLVLPEVQETEVSIKPEDLKIDVYRAGGHGGQSVNTADSAVRIKHLPSGIVVQCQNERSQLQNKAQAMNVLYARLHDKIQQEEQDNLDQQRLDTLGTGIIGSRSSKVRTYNFPQHRVTDHRSNYTSHSLSVFLDGDIQECINSLKNMSNSNGNRSTINYNFK